MASIRVLYAAITQSSFSAVATIFRDPSGSGRCNAPWSRQELACSVVVGIGTGERITVMPEEAGTAPAPAVPTQPEARGWKAILMSMYLIFI
ncbi:hypothetical protein ACE103_10205 [Bradyrhizobium sp. ma5]|uniref:hypothetical protein n=1 Tax=Bradyrhizobium sp. ma5 TaxID=3344828 RepID=UPI0035D3DBEF